jgi:hypothetical protein
MKRFTKAKLVDDLVGLAVRVQNNYAFDRNGLSQIWPRSPTDKEKELIEKAYQYGRFTAFENIATWVEEGDFGA